MEKKVVHRRADARKIKHSKKKLKRELLEEKLGGMSDRFFEEMDNLRGKEFCDTYLAAAKHVLPSLKSIEYKDTSETGSKLIETLKSLALQEDERNKKAQP